MVEKNSLYYNEVTLEGNLLEDGDVVVPLSGLDLEQTASKFSTSVWTDLSTVSRLGPEEVNKRKLWALFSASRRPHSISAIFVATHEGISGMA